MSDEAAGTDDTVADEEGATVVIDPSELGGGPPAWSGPAAVAAPVKRAGAPADPNEGRVLGGQYRLERAVGAGGVGRVYVATQLSLGRSVAVKLMRPELEADSQGERFAERFFREASLAGQLSHPNIVTVHDYGQDSDGTCFIVMELVEGQSLKQVMKAGPIEPERALELFVQITSGLRHAHRAGLVHRDVKPGNVQLTAGDGGAEVAKLLDFGLVKSDVPEVTEITREGSFLGTPHYAAPEQVKGMDADHRADIYSLGVMLYRALSGVLPYKNRNAMAMALSHVRDPYPPMSERAPGVAVDPTHEAIVQRCMQKAADDRYPDADALLVDLQAALAHLRSPPEASVEVVATRPVRWPWFVGAVAAVGLAVGGWLAQGSAEPVVAAVDSGAPEVVAEPVDTSAQVLQDVGPSAVQVALASEPSGASVAVDGEVVGQTPWVGTVPVVDGLAASVVLSLKGYEDAPVELDPGDGTASATVSLSRVARPSKAPAAAQKTAPSKATSTPKKAPSEASSRRAGTRRSASPTKTVDGVVFSASEAAATLSFANSADNAAFNGAGIRTQEFNKVKAARPFSSIEALGAAPGVGPKTMERMKAAAGK